MLLFKAVDKAGEFPKRSYKMKKIVSLLLVFMFILSIFPLTFTEAASGNMKLAAIFTDNMILQRNEKICIFGSGNGSGSITLGDVTKEVTSTTGSWSVYFEPLKTSTTPITFTAKFGTGTVVLDNVLVGDVYITSGQSNMELSLGNTEQKGTVKANPLLRFFNKAGKWQQFTDTNVESVSAISVLFAQELDKNLKKDIPIGIISSSVGASRVEDWTHKDYCYCEEYDLENTAHSDITKYDKGHHDLYTNYIEPIEKLTVAGVLWYQGESNRGIGEAYRYFDMFKTMVECWRKRFDDPDLPFYTVQIMLYSGNGTKDLNGNEIDEYNIRIAQARASAEIKNVTLCSMLSLEDTLLPNGNMDIHPTDKLPIAKALVNAAIATYYKPLGDYSDTAPEYSGPIFKSIYVKEGKATVHFLHTGGGLKSKQGIEQLTEFEVRSGSGMWVHADAKIEGDSVIVTADGIDRIIGVRLGYKNKPSINLYNGAGYCASPFIWEEEGAKLDHLPTDIWTGDETSHWKICQIVGCQEIFEKAEHSGGTATCADKASCELCERKYGLTDKNNHSGETIISGKIEPTEKAEGYTGDTKCLSCNALLEKGKAVPVLQGKAAEGFPWGAVVIIILAVLLAGGGVTAFLIIKNKKTPPVTEENITLPEE